MQHLVKTGYVMGAKVGMNDIFHCSRKTANFDSWNIKIVQASLHKVGRTLNVSSYRERSNECVFPFEIVGEPVS